jgi:uncharacterized repeat protein (TIGR04138 family)
MEMTPDEQVEAIFKEDKRYDPQAYFFLMISMGWKKRELQREGHMKASEVMDGFCEYAHLNFGLMSRCVFEQWGVRQTDDIGNMVYNFVSRDFWGKEEDDSQEEFQEAFDLLVRMDDYKIESEEN